MRIDLFLSDWETGRRGGGVPYSLTQITRFHTLLGLNPLHTPVLRAIIQAFKPLVKDKLNLIDSPLLLLLVNVVV